MTSRKGAVEFEKIVAWALGVLLLLVLVLFLVSQFGAEGDGLLAQFLERLRILN